MTNPTDVTRQIHRTTITTMALVSGLVFGIILLAAGDWLAGLVIVVVTVVGLARADSGHPETLQHGTAGFAADEQIRQLIGRPLLASAIRPLL